MASVVIVGGGILGTMHALEARRRGWSVAQLDADLEPRSATVRNFGMVWVSGRACGGELDLALRARHRWEEIAGDVPDIGFRACGSLTVVTQPEQVAVLEQVCARPDAADRGFELCEPGAARARNDVLRGPLAAALWCGRDAVVEPAAVLPAVRRVLARQDDHYRWCGGRTATRITAGAVVDHTGDTHRGDLVLVCPGVRTDGAIAELVAGQPIRPVRLQMAQTEPLGRLLPTMLADEDSLRYYPGFDVPARAGLVAPAPIVAEHHLQLLVSQRLDTSLTIGDTHQYASPFDVGVDEAPYTHLTARLERLFGTAPPPLRRRWSGTYSQCVAPDAICLRTRPEEGIIVVTGPGGRGMTLAPAIAEQTWKEL